MAISNVTLGARGKYRCSGSQHCAVADRAGRKMVFSHIYKYLHKKINTRSIIISARQPFTMQVGVEIYGGTTVEKM